MRGTRQREGLDKGFNGNSENKSDKFDKYKVIDENQAEEPNEQKDSSTSALKKQVEFDDDKNLNNESSSENLINELSNHIDNKLEEAKDSISYLMKLVEPSHTKNSEKFK